MHSIGLEHFEKLAIQAQIPEYLVLQTVRETVEATFSAWDNRHKNYELSKEILKRIQHHMKSLSLSRSYSK